MQSKCPSGDHKQGTGPKRGFLRSLPAIQLVMRRSGCKPAEGACSQLQQNPNDRCAVGRVRCTPT